MKKSSGKTKQNAKPIKKGWEAVAHLLRLIFHSVLSAATLFILIIYILSAFSDHVDPRQFHYISYLGIGYHLALIASLIWVVAMLALRRWKLSLVMVVALLISHEQISRYFPMNLFEPEIEVKGKSDTLRVMTYNTCISGQAHLSRIKENIPVLDVIRESKADIVCLQEYAFSLSKKGHTQEEMRKSLAKNYPYYDFMPNSGSRALGIALFSKYPIKKKKRIDEAGKGYVSSMYYELDVNGRQIALVNNHLHSNNIAVKDRELYDEMIEKLEADSAKIERFRTGILRSLGKAYISRARQSNLIRSFIDEETKGKDMTLLVCGDLNDTPISYCYRTMRGNLSDTWQDAGFGAGTTFNKYHLWFRIDHIFHSSDLQPLDIKVMKDVECSDHYPVIATFVLCN